MKGSGSLPESCNTRISPSCSSTIQTCKADARPDKLLETLRGESKRIQRYKRLSLDDEQTEEKRDPREVLDEYEDEIEKATEDKDATLDLSNFTNEE